MVFNPDTYKNDDLSSHDLKLEKSRFHFSKETSDMLEEARKQLEQWKKQEPGIVGMGFFGSRTVGKNMGDSDLDTIIFYDAEKFTREGDARTIAKDIEEELGQINEQSKTPIPYGIAKIVDLSEHHILEIVDTFERFMEKIGPVDFPEKDTLLSRPVWEMISPFFLSIGGDVYKARAVILSELEKRENGAMLWDSVMTLLSYVERSTSTDKRGPLVAYRSYPHTLSHAKSYFHLS